MATTAKSRKKKPEPKVTLTLRVTPQEHAVLVRNAKRAKRSLNSHVKSKMLGEDVQKVPERKSREEMLQILKTFREEVRRASGWDDSRGIQGRNLLEELIAERRAEAALE